MRREQDKPGQQPHDHIAVVGILSPDLAGFRRQQMLRRAKAMSDLAAPSLGRDQTWCRERRLAAEQREAILGEFVHNDDCDCRVHGTARGEAEGSSWRHTPRRLPLKSSGVGTPMVAFRHSIPQPAYTPLHASMVTLRRPAQDLGSGWLATPFL